MTSSTPPPDAPTPLTNDLMLPEAAQFDEAAQFENDISTLTGDPTNAAANDGAEEQTVLREEMRAGERRLSAALRAARVKRACRIEEVITQHGIALRVVGDRERLVGVCPFHHERRGSFTVYPETQSFCCFGCYAAGDVITFIRLFHNASFAEALRLLGEEDLDRVTAELANVPDTPKSHPLARRARIQRWRAQLSSDTHSDGQRHDPASAARSDASIPNMFHASHVPLTTDPVSSVAPDNNIVDGKDSANDAKDAERDNDAQLVRLALLWTTSVIAIEGLSRSPQALTYLGERGISFELARECHLGYLADEYLEESLTSNVVLAPVARAMGLLNRADHCALAHRLIIPEIRQGMTTQLIGRVIPGDNTPLPQIKYYLLPGKATKGLLGYGAALARLEGRVKRMQQRTHRGTPWHSYSAARPPTDGWSGGLLGGPPLRGILVLEGALDYVIARGWNLPVLPVALLSSFPGRGQLAELLELQQRSGGLPLLLQLDDDEAGARGTALIAKFLDAVGAPWRRLPPLPRLPMLSPAYKDLGEVGPLGPDGRALMMDCLEQVITEGAKRSDTRSTASASTPARQHASTPARRVIRVEPM